MENRSCKKARTSSLVTVERSRGSQWRKAVQATSCCRCGISLCTSHCVVLHCCQTWCWAAVLSSQLTAAVPDVREHRKPRWQLSPVGRLWYPRTESFSGEEFASSFYYSISIDSVILTYLCVCQENGFKQFGNYSLKLLSFSESFYIERKCT